MPFDCAKRKGDTRSILKNSSKRARMVSCSNSDSGRSSMSGSSFSATIESKLLPSSSTTQHDLAPLAWPSLVLLTKIEEPIANGINRRRFPDPVCDKSLLFACYGSGKSMLKLRHCKTELNPNQEIFLERDKTERETKENILRRSRSEDCSYFISLDSVSMENSSNGSNKLENNIMLCDVRDHAIASKCLPDEITGYWVRMFGHNNKFTLLITLWQIIHKEKKNFRFKRESFSDDHMVKVNELKVEIRNGGTINKIVKEKKENKIVTHNTLSFSMMGFAGCMHLPTFCSKETYVQITTCLRECIENGNFPMFSEMYDKFCRPLLVKGGMDRDSVELKLLLSCEKSHFHAYQGDYPDAKKLLQYVVENVVSKSPNKTFLLNRAYSFLANVQTMEGNYGTAEECLNILQLDKRNGSPFEDVGFFYLVHAVTLLNFSKKLPQLSNELRKESLRAFVKAEAHLQESLPGSFNRMCRMYLNKARLFICKHYSNCCSTNLSQAFEYLKVVEGYGETNLSTKSKCLLLATKSDCLYFQKEIYSASKMLDEAERLAIELKFEEDIVLCKTIRSQWNEVQCTQLVNNDDSTISKGFYHKESIMNCDVYDADESS